MNNNQNQLLMMQQVKMELQIMLNKQVKEHMVVEKIKYQKDDQNQNDM